MRRFALYPKEQHWWSFNDYGAVVDEVARLGAKTALEFGPGSSTLALVEGGCRSVDALEDDGHWYDVYATRLAKAGRDAGARVVLHRYTWSDPVNVPAVGGMTFDVALIDGPRYTPNRVAVLLYCLERARWVILPTEEQPWLRETAARVAEQRGVPVVFRETGPLAGSFATFGPTC